MIRVRNLEKRYSKNAPSTLKDVTFEVGPGVLGAILGGSGAGKTTLLRCLVGLEAFDAGEIVVGDSVIRPATGDVVRVLQETRRALHGKIGLVFQSFELFPHLTVRGNITLAPMLVLGTPRAEAEAKAEKLLADLELAERADFYPDHLSGGQRQRVAIARALAMGPKVLLYDEPTSALDPSLKQEVIEVLHEVRHTGVTQIVVTHDVVLAREATDRVFVLHQGEVVEQGVSRDVLTNPTHAATRKLLGQTAAAGS